MHIRPLERKDLPNIHDLDNQRQTMAFWFEEPYESLDELSSLYDKHIHDETERRFVIDMDGEFAGIVELVNINFLHRTTEIQIIMAMPFRGRRLSEEATLYGIHYAFDILNMHKVYLYVDVDNAPAVHIYEKIGFVKEGHLRKQFFANGEYHDSYIMGLFREEIGNCDGLVQ
ncbi:MAG: GNAT family N-acetyltransferase [Spirochaetaceae bacterium]|jgi:diamine N-acetyltransferase|nr:GNAT family N-acetyltransferase [Spirochaetaceae bacterium]